MVRGNHVRTQPRRAATSSPRVTYPHLTYPTYDAVSGLLRGSFAELTLGLCVETPL
jgi:hypothetical protein